MERRFEIKKYGKVYPITLAIHSYLEGNLQSRWYAGKAERRSRGAA